ncbi:MAG: hypothetical protein JWN01_365 [Patescibacteria group bacterium]|nr:hypothetical protein [Patescibacteria group bacterium]
MNIASQLPEPLNSFVVDVPANQYYDFELEANSTYPLKGVTYPVDYGNIPGYIAEDGHELDFFVGQLPDDEMGYVVVDRGEHTPDEHKFYVGLTPQEVRAVLEQLKPVLLKHEKIVGIDALLSAIEKFKNMP